MLAMTWLKIIMKHYDGLCYKIYRSSLPPSKTDSVESIFQHRLRLGFLYFLNKKVCNFDILST